MASDKAHPESSATLTALAASVTNIEAGLAGLTPMLQFIAKAADRSDRAREQQFLELRAHLTAETDRLASGLRADALDGAVLDLFRELLPSLDEMDDVLRVHADRAVPGLAALGAVRRRLRDTFARLGIEEVAVARGAAFDPELHEGVPCADDDAKGMPSASVVEVTRAGYRAKHQLIRAPRVAVTP